MPREGKKLKFEQLHGEVQRLESSIELINQDLKNVMSAGSGRICGSCDFFFAGLARRTGAVTQAFCRAVRDDNHFVAPALIRLNLEHLLVLHAGDSYETGNLHDFTTALMKGKKPRDLKNLSGKKMTDRELVISLGKALDRATSSRIQDLYAWCNQFTHFGTPMLVSSLVDLNDDGHFRMLLFGSTFQIPAVQPADVQNWVQAMGTINAFVRQGLDRWIATREQMWDEHQGHALDAH